MHRIQGGCAIAAMLTFLAATGCSHTDGNENEQTLPTPAAESQAPVEDPRGGRGIRFTADSTIVGAHPIPFESWTRLPDNRIAVNFQAGAPECYGVDASVTETTDTVTVALRAGRPSDAVGRMCTMVAVFGTLEVSLNSPLGERTVLRAH
ncbi:hypothetical protein [Nocardia sp. CNY236]|uniref:hypothetical protein n=1 Tax=Nocardia sp. CNY236 TaxID=1169152 RepID=UPI000491E1DD|nr:hypothetical protein [Nocardia sp. CNY236]